MKLLDRINTFDECAACGSKDLYFAYDIDRWELTQICNDCCMVHSICAIPPKHIVEKNIISRGEK